MARETVTRTINGSEWVTTQWTGRNLIRYQAGLSKLLAPVAAIGVSSGGSILDMNVGAAVGALVDRLDEDHVLKLILGMLATTNAGGKDLSNEALFDEYFAGNSAELYKGLIFVIEANLPDFFGEGGLDIGGLLSLAQGQQSSAGS